jgi:hypothetical protein
MNGNAARTASEKSVFVVWRMRSEVVSANPLVSTTYCVVTEP